MRRADVSADQLGRTETAWKLMEPWGVTPDTARLERHAVYTFRGRWVREWRRGRIFLAGDSAHLMPPFLGQGMCSGLRDASALAWRLSLVESGRASVSILDSYGTERGAHVQEIIEGAVALGKVICELDPLRAAERDAGMRAELNDPEAVTVEPPHPRLGQPSITEAGDASAGRLSVQARVEADGLVGLFDDVVGGAWQLIGLDADPMADVSAKLRTWFEDLGGTATALTVDGGVRDIDGAYRAWFEAHGCSLLLARPDFYVYGTGATQDAARLLGDLRNALGVPDTGTNEHIEEGALP